MRDNQDGSREFEERLLDGLASRDVEVIRRLVQNEEVRLAESGKRELEPIEFPAGKGAHRLLKRLTRKKKRCERLPRILESFRAGVDADIENCRRAVEALRVLGTIRYGHARADEYRRILRLMETKHFAEKGRLSRAVRAHKRDPLAGVDSERNIGKQHPLAEGAGKPAYLEREVRTTRVGFKRHRKGLNRILRLFTGGFLRFFKMRTPRAEAPPPGGIGRPAGNVRKFFDHRLELLNLFLVGPRSHLTRNRAPEFFNPVRRIIPGKRPRLATINLDDARADAVKQVAVMRNDDDRARILTDKLFEPGEGPHVEMISRFVENEHIGTGKKGATKRENVPLTARKSSKRRLRRVGKTEAFEIPERARLRFVAGTRVIGCAEITVGLENPLEFTALHTRHLLLERGKSAPLFRDRFHHELDGRQFAYREVLRYTGKRLVNAPAHRAAIIPVFPGENPHERRLPRAVPADHPDLFSRHNPHVGAGQDSLDPIVFMNIDCFNHVVLLQVRGHKPAGNRGGGHKKNRGLPDLSRGVRGLLPDWQLLTRAL